jgi:DNA-binding CsgD family transcriptional regulator
MDLDTHTATALLAALGLAREHGGASAALAAAGIELPEADRFEGLAGDFGEVVGSAPGSSMIEALALGFLAGRVAPRPRTRTARDPTSFVMDSELVVQAAEGQSIMRLPWFDDGLFVGRQLPDISEMPEPVRRLCVGNYTAGLQGERGSFSFVSYGHAYSVEAVPMHGESGGVEAVLAIATPGGTHAAAACAYERIAERLESFAASSERLAERHGTAGRPEAEAAEWERARRARHAAERASGHALRLRARDIGTAPAAPPSITPREAEVLSLASHGLTYAEMAEQMVVSIATVRTHLENIYAKLGVSEKAAAVATALRHGLIE